MTIDKVAGASALPPRSADAQLKRMCHEMEAVFLRQLLEAMRGSDKEESLFGNSTGEEMFTSLLDDQMASEAANHMPRGLGDALYRQLSRRLTRED